MPSDGSLLSLEKGDGCFGSEAAAASWQKGRVTEPACVPAAGVGSIWVRTDTGGAPGHKVSQSHLCGLQAAIAAEQCNPVKWERGEGEVSPVSNPLLLLMGTGHSHGNKARGIDSLSFSL